MEIIDNKVLLLNLRNPNKVTTLIPKSRMVGENQVAVKWGLDEIRVLKNLQIKNIPSPIMGQYDWPGLHKPFDHQKVTSSFLTSFLGVVFFETTSDTQLSLMPILNSFGIQKIYSQPDYLIGLLKSFFVIESYLKILATSLLGALIIKLTTVVVGYDNFNEIIFNLGYSENVDLVNLITKVNKIEPLIFIVAMILSAFAVWLLSKTFVKN